MQVSRGARNDSNGYLRWLDFRKPATGPLSNSLYHEPSAFRPLNRPAFLAAPSADTQADTQVPNSVVETTSREVVQNIDQHTRVEVKAADDVPLSLRLVDMEWQRRQQQILTQVNANQPAGCHLMACQIIPSSVFVGEAGRFLMMACDFFVHCSANTLLLPAMATGEQFHSLPCHASAEAKAQDSQAMAQVLRLRTRVVHEHNRVAAAVARGDFSLLFQTKEKRLDAKQELASICKSLAIATIGLTAFTSHEMRFHALLRDSQA